MLVKKLSKFVALGLAVISLSPSAFASGNAPYGKHYLKILTPNYMPSMRVYFADNHGYWHNYCKNTTPSQDWEDGNQVYNYSPVYIKRYSQPFCSGSYKVSQGATVPGEDGLTYFWYDGRY